jgi:eukaryotic-like serine/threonine-protein kinase
VREAKLGASLNHPNLVSVFDTATDDEGVLIIMEYVQGEPLSRALRRGPLAPERVARMASELGAALDHAHGQGVVHRDVKPGNVLLRDDGVTKLVDLGIATAAGHTRITRTGIVLGTASYMAPEQLEGREVGPAADVYALAAVCFEALAGERARPGRSPMEVAQTIATEPAPDLRERWAGAPPGTAELLERAMARDPGKRPRTAGELGSRLRGTLEEAPQGTAATRPMDLSTAGVAADSAGPAPSTAAPASGRSPTAPNGVSDRGAAPRPPGTLGPPRRGNRPRLLPLALAGALVALAVATIVIAFGSGGGGDPSSPQDGAERPRASEQNRQEPKQRTESEQPAPPAEQPEQQAPAAPAPAPAPEEDQPEQEQPAASGPAEGARLNNQGFQLMSEGRYDEAIPILQRALDSFPQGTSDLNYAYTLFNLGQALRLAGRPEEAIPILEQRLEIPNQTGVVRRELELARRAAGRE